MSTPAKELDHKVTAKNRDRVERQRKKEKRRDQFVVSHFVLVVYKTVYK